MNQRDYPNGIVVTECDTGLLVAQQEEAYVARNWRLTPAVDHLICKALESGLSWMIREDHPLKKARWPNPRGVVYLAFSPSPNLQWSVAIDTFRERKNDFGHAVFNGKYHSQFVERGIPFSFEQRNKGSGHLVVERDLVLSTISELKTFNHSVLAHGRKSKGGLGFTTEYVIQHKIISQWKSTPWSQRYDFVRDEFPVDGGLTSRRIDILAHNRKNGDWLVLELKRAEANLAAVEQAAEYVLALKRRDDFASGQVRGVLVAERISPKVQAYAKSELIEAYEVTWPLFFKKVA